jgi:predicted ArsR family transcriptional regulator
MAKLSDTALVLLNKAATRDDRLIEPPNHLPAAARNAVVRSLLKQGLLIEDAVELNNPLAWRTDESDADLRCSIALRMTDDGFRALNLDPPRTEPAEDDETGATGTDAPTAPDAATVQAEALAVAEALEAAQGAPTPAPRGSLRDAAAAVLEEWDDRDNQQYGLPEAIERLRAALAAKPERPARKPGAPRKPREGTKQQSALTMLRREEGATVSQIAEATGWASHTVRGFLAGLKKKGFLVATLERVRMVGPNKEGAKRSYTIYAITE